MTGSPPGRQARAHGDAGRAGGDAELPAHREKAGIGGEGDTRQTILKAAQQVFAEFGFGGASVRRIAAAAGVNPALISYYFAGKEGLFAECYRAHAEPVGLERLRLLDELVATGKPATLRELLRAYIAPVLGEARKDPSTRAIKYFGHYSQEDTSFSAQLSRKYYFEINSRFLDEIAAVLPHLTREILARRLYFMISALQIVAAQPPGLAAMVGRQSPERDALANMNALLDFAESGFLGGTAMESAPPMGH